MKNKRNELQHCCCDEYGSREGTKSVFPSSEVCHVFNDSLFTTSISLRNPNNRQRGEGYPKISCPLPVTVGLHLRLKDRSWTRRLTQSPGLGVRLYLSFSKNVFRLLPKEPGGCCSAAVRTLPRRSDSACRLVGSLPIFRHETSDVKPLFPL
jgi:hypothetical protein